MHPQNLCPRASFLHPLSTQGVCNCLFEYSKPQHSRYCFSVPTVLRILAIAPANCKCATSILRVTFVPAVIRHTTCSTPPSFPVKATFGPLLNAWMKGSGHPTFSLSVTLYWGTGAPWADLFHFDSATDCMIGSEGGRPSVAKKFMIMASLRTVCVCERVRVYVYVHKGMYVTSTREHLNLSSHHKRDYNKTKISTPISNWDFNPSEYGSRDKTKQHTHTHTAK